MRVIQVNLGGSNLDRCGIVRSISHPLAGEHINLWYLSTYKTANIIVSTTYISLVSSCSYTWRVLGLVYCVIGISWWYGASRGNLETGSRKNARNAGRCRAWTSSVILYIPTFNQFATIKTISYQTLYFTLSVSSCDQHLIKEAATLPMKHICPMTCLLHNHQYLCLSFSFPIHSSYDWRSTRG